MGVEKPSSRAWIGYVVPMVAFMALTFLEGWEGSGVPYPILYTFKAVVVTIALVMSRKVWKEIRFDGKMLAVGLIVGVLAYFEWIYVDQHTHHFSFLGSRSAYNPFHEIPNTSLRSLFMAVRFYGLVVMVPVMEELFWRSFLLRWITDPEFANLKVGQYSWGAFAAVTGLFALSHPEWLAAAIFAAAMALLLKRTGSLFACIVAHATTNLLLGLYVIHTGQWQLW
jgi:CAAX prenyl protease-like protein